MSRWFIIGVSVILWSAATAALWFGHDVCDAFRDRLFVGIGEGGYGPVAPAIISDFFPDRVTRARAFRFLRAIPVGSALGYVIGGFAASHCGWQAGRSICGGNATGILLRDLVFLGNAIRAINAERCKTERATLRDYLNRLRAYQIVMWNTWR